MTYIVTRMTTVTTSNVRKCPYMVNSGPKLSKKVDVFVLAVSGTIKEFDKC